MRSTRFAVRALLSTVLFAAVVGIGVCEAAATISTVTVTRAGSGTGTVTGSSGLINCGLTCSDTYDDGLSLTLTAAPSAGSQFIGWLGPCTGTASCQFVVNGGAAAIATFAPA